MSYILKNSTSAYISTKLTDAGRRKLSQGNFNISYFQVGDSEVSYNAITSGYDFIKTNILEPAFNSHNISGVPESNKQYIKYPYYVDGITGNTYGIPYVDSVVTPIFNSAAIKGFFVGDTTLEEIEWSTYTTGDFAINSNYIVDLSTLDGTNVINVEYSNCTNNIFRLPSVGDFVTIYYNTKITKCECGELNPTPTPTPTQTPTPTPTPNPCDPPSPSPTPSSTPSPTPTLTLTPTDEFVDCYMSIDSCHPMMTYKIIDICGDKITLDRPTPRFSFIGSECYVRILVYPPKMTTIYDSDIPVYNPNVINFQSDCNAGETFTNVWNMNIPWSENPAGLLPSFNAGYNKFGSVNYLGSKEYFGYSNSSGQTDSDSVYYYNSFDDIIIVEPYEQKSISILHYTNQSVGLYYGEKFALEPFDENNAGDTGQARNFKVHVPWIMWHKNPECCYGQTFWVDPPGFESFNLFQIHYLTSNKNNDMNYPGHRYYHLWDTNPNTNGLPNRVGKVFPDQKMIIFDDEEIVAAMSYKSNRNWTLPAPKLGFIPPNVCGELGSPIGLLENNDEYLYVTYILNDTNFKVNSLHCNYYTKIVGPNVSCTNLLSQNVTVQFGPEFGCLNQPFSPYVTTTTTQEPLTTSTTTICPTSCDNIDGFYSNSFKLVVQKVSGTSRPDSTKWKVIDFTSQLSSKMINGYITEDGLTSNTFVITKDLYENAPTYKLNDYIPLTPANFTGTSLNFGDEYYFYGSIETDIEASIYEMRYKIMLSQNEFQTPSNPTWSVNKQRYITEIGLYDNQKNLMIISKLQSPSLRQGTQQFLVKLDF